MNKELLNCWEIIKCERHKAGKKVNELGECIVSMEGMGHSCWAVAGTLCGGEIQGTTAQKIGYCTSCEVYGIYNR
jgi:methyl-accepting chemotaxis protein